MKKTALYMALMAAAVSASAQQDVAAKYAKYITADDARRHLSILASDAFEGRETGKPGADKAAHYIADEFKRLGLNAPVNGSYFLDVPLTVTTFTLNSFAVNGAELTYGKDYYTLSGNAATQSINLHEIIYAGNATEDELKNIDVAGKAVIINMPENLFTGDDGQKRTASMAFRQSLQGLRKASPVLILVAGNTPPNWMGTKQQERMSLKRETPAPAASRTLILGITPEMAGQIVKGSGKTYEQFKAGGAASQPVKTDISIKSEFATNDAKAVDVLGFMPGSDPKLKDEVLVFSAHYDHIGLNPNGPDKVNNGADDDGSGTTGVLEIARAFSEAKKHGKGPRRSILFLGNVGEEKGLLGSEYYTDHPVFPLANTITDLNIDMIGRIGFDYQGKPDSANNVYVIGSSMLSSDLHKITEQVNNKYTHLDLDYKYDDPNDPNRFYYRSDHYNFAKHGVPIIFYFNGVHQDYHQPGDEVSKINFPLLAKRAQLVFYTGWDLANADKRPVVDGKVEASAGN